MIGVMRTGFDWAWYEERRRGEKVDGILQLRERGIEQCSGRDRGLKSETGLRFSKSPDRERSRFLNKEFLPRIFVFVPRVQTLGQGGFFAL